MTTSNRVSTQVVSLFSGTCEVFWWMNHCQMPVNVTVHSFNIFGCVATTLLCSIFLPVLVKAIPCIGKDLGMCTVAYASLMVEL